MNLHDHSAESDPLSSPDSQDRDRVTTSRSKWVFGGFAAIVLLMLAIEYRVHLVAWLPWIILAACPLMHLFKHGRHGDGSKEPGARS